MSPLPPYTTHELIHERLPLIFPAGTHNRQALVRELSAKTVFVMLYIGAVEDQDIYLGPVHVYRMTEEQASLVDEENRVNYAEKALRGFQPEGKRWYADNTRESVRDETLREGLVEIGAVSARSDVATTSSKPRYRLKSDFAALFDPELAGEGLTAAITAWQDKNLSKSARTRQQLAGRATASKDNKILVRFPDGETRKLSAGPSSEISKSVIETFAINFLEQPVVLWLSTSEDKVVSKDDELAAKIGLDIKSDKNLPDVILVDLGPEDPILVFMEVVATDGAITPRRQEAIYELTDAAGFDRKQVVFVTAYMDRDSPGFIKTIRQLAWNSFAWFVSEPEHLMIMRDEADVLSKYLSNEI